MATEPPSIKLIVYAPPLIAGDGRPAAVIQELERATETHLGMTVSEEGRIIALAQRDTWLATETNDGGFPLVCNDDESRFVSAFGTAMPAAEAPGGQASFEAHVTLPLDAAGIVAAANSLECIAECTRAFWGHATPFDAAIELARQTAPTLEGPPAPARGLPMLAPSWRLDAPEVPHRLGWLNYWSAATARILGFPDPDRDNELLSRARKTRSGAWLVRLTNEPLDLDNADHLRTVLRIYERFPTIGGRATST
jgi:hypothetical protein